MLMRVKAPVKDFTLVSLYTYIDYKRVPKIDS